MGTTYTATFTTRCYKQHRCIACDAKYSYVLVRNIKGTGSSEAAASAAADALARKSIQNDVDLHPCPNCGVVQPDMIAPAHRSRFMIAAAVGAIGIVIALIVGAAEGTTLVNSAWIAVASAVAALGLGLWGAFYDPNRNLISNRNTSENSVRASRLRFDEKPPYAPGSVIDPPRASRATIGAGLGLIVAAIVAAAAPPALVALNGWKTNTACYPEVVGPGDQARFYLPTKISAVKGMYKGTAQAAAVEAGAAGAKPIPLAAETQQSSWGDTISGKSVSNQNTALRADIRFPNDANLAGKTLKVDMQVQASYPHAVGGQFGVQNETGKHSAEVMLAGVGAGATFKTVWWGGQAIAIGLIGLALLLWHQTSNALVRRAHPTLVAPTG